MAFIPTDAEIDKTREVAGELDYDFISSLIDELTDAQWERALELMDAWDAFNAGEVSFTMGGGRDGVGLSDLVELDDIRKRMRLLLGLPELRDSSLTGGMASIGVLNEFRW